MKRSFIFTCLLTLSGFSALCFLAGGCSSSAPQQPRRGLAPQAPANATGVSISPTGEAVAEVNGSADKLFEAAETFFRKRCKITFINYSLRQLDAEDKGSRFALKISELTTGQTGLSLAATSGDKNRANASLARELADQILQTFRQSAAKPR
jgi:hypothetical protein